MVVGAQGLLPHDRSLQPYGQGQGWLAIRRMSDSHGCTFGAASALSQVTRIIRNALGALFILLSSIQQRQRSCPNKIITELFIPYEHKTFAAMSGLFLQRVALRRQALLVRPRFQRRWQSSNTKPEEPIPVPNTVLPPPPAAVDVPFWMRLGPLTRVTQAYGRAQRKRPWVVQLATSLTIFCLGDICSQRISGKEYDVERTGRSMIIGSIISIPNYEW